jgi:TonB family protein
MEPFLFFIVGLALVYPVFGQVTISNPHELTPEIGWDSLLAKIEYPELAKRALLEGKVDAAVNVDSSGNVLSIDILHCDADIFKEPVVKAFKSTKWKCQKPCGRWIEVPVYFFLGDEGRHPLYKNVDKPPVSVY